MITLVEQPQPQITDPVIAAAALPTPAERAQALLAICREYGIGVSAERLTSYGKAWRSLIDALQRDRGAVLVQLPDKMVISEPWQIIGEVLDTAPEPPKPVRRPHYVMSWMERYFGATWEAARPLYIDNLCPLLKDSMKWSDEEVARAKEQLTNMLTAHDRIEQLEHDRIPILRPGKQGREMIEIRRSND